MIIIPMWLQILAAIYMVAGIIKMFVLGDIKKSIDDLKAKL